MQRCGPAGPCDHCADDPDESRSDEAVQRQPDGGTRQAGPTDAGAPDAGPADAGRTDAGDAGAPGPSITYLTVRDASIGVGGQVVPDLDAVKARIMAKQQTGEWTLVLAIHGSEGRLAAQSPPDWQKDAKFYGPADIDKLFGGDGAFVTWRDQFGPKRVVLLGCQVGAPFEQVVANNLTRRGAGLTAQGLGTHCKPITRIEPLLWGPPGKETPVRTRADFNRLDEAGKQWFTEQLRKWNEKWGYLGMSPVSNGDLLRFFFDEEPKGAWPIVEVNKDVNGTLTPLDVPYHNRIGNSAFLQNCNMGVGTLKQRETK